MKKQSLLSSRPLHPIQMGFFILIELLLIFGGTFSKFNLYGPFYLYDTALFILGLISAFYFVKQTNKEWNWPVLVLLILSFLYLLYSFFITHNPTNYIIRQYALFIYLGIVWLIFSSFVNDNYQKYNVRFIVIIAIASVALQIGHIMYLSVFTDGFSLFTSMNYFSKMSLVGTIVAGAYVMVFIKTPLYKWLLAMAYIALTTTLGHSSAFLAAFAIVVTYVILQLPNRVKIAGAIIMGLSILAFFLLLPQFSDKNAEWRLVFWKHSLIDIIKNYYSILGHGFGVPYPTQATLDALRENLNSPWFEVRPEEMYTSPMHNSFITLAFHIGLLPSLLVFFPLLKPFKKTILTNSNLRNPHADFLILSWVGLAVWSSFNVVLELPHTSAYIWLVYFSLIYQFRSSKLSDEKA